MTTIEIYQVKASTVSWIEETEDAAQMSAWLYACKYGEVVTVLDLTTGASWEVYPE